MSLRVFLFAKKMKLLTKGGIHCISQVFPWHFYFMREHSLVELTEHDNSAANIIVHSIYAYMYCCIHNTYQCVPIMNGRCSGTREKSRKQALDSAWSMEMSTLTRDGTAEPVSRDQILRRERGQGIIHFPCSASWPRAGLATLPSCDGHTYKQALHTYRCSYTYMHIQQ